MLFHACFRASASADSFWRRPRELVRLGERSGSCASRAALLRLYGTRRQLMIDVSIINVRIFGIRGFVLGGAAMMINFGITLSAMFLLPQFIQNAMGVAVAMTGIIMLPGGIVNAIVSMLAGRLYDRVGARIPARIGFALSIAGFDYVAACDGSSTIAYVIVAHIVLMIGVPLAMSPCQTSTLNSLPRSFPPMAPLR